MFSGVWAIELRADSPLSSCYFAPAYRDVPEIATMIALEAGTDDDLLLESLTSVYILDAERSLELRLAMLNALGFGQVANAELMVQYVAVKYGANTEDWRQLVLQEKWVALSHKCERLGVTTEDLITMAYAMAMAHYLNPRCALPLIALAGPLLEENETAAWIGELILSQFTAETDLCEVYVAFAELPLKSFPQGKFREEAKRRIMDYIGLYEEACLPDPYTDAYYLHFPVYDTLQTPQKTNAAKYVDLHFVGAVEGVLAYKDHVNNNGIDGGKVAVEIRNSGNTANIPTNLYCVMLVMHEGKEERLVRQVQIPPIKANQNEVVAIYFPGVWWQPDSGRMELIIDNAGQINEKNEANNSALMGN